VAKFDERDVAKENFEVLYAFFQKLKGSSASANSVEAFSVIEVVLDFVQSA